MMMKFMFNVAAVSWMMSDSRMGLVLVYNALGLMSNKLIMSVYMYIHEKLHYVQAVICTFVLTVYSIYIQGEVVHAVQLVYHPPSICRKWSRVAVSFRSISFLLQNTLQNKLVSVFILKLSTLTVTVVGLYFDKWRPTPSCLIVFFRCPFLRPRNYMLLQLSHTDRCLDSLTGNARLSRRLPYIGCTL